MPGLKLNDVDPTAERLRSGAIFVMTHGDADPLIGVALSRRGWTVADRPEDADVILAIDEDFHAALERSRHAGIVYVSERTTEAHHGADVHLVTPRPEEVVEATERALALTKLRRAGHERVHDAIECVQEAFFALQRDHTVTYQNRRAGALMAQLQASSGDIVGKRFFEQLPGEVDARVTPMIAECMRTTEPTQLDARLHTLDMWVEVRIFPMPDGVGVFILDISDRKLAEAALVSAQRALAQSEKLAGLGGLVAGVAHEVRTPITYIGNSQQMVRRHLEAGASRGASAAEVLEACAQHLDAGDEGILRVTRIVKDLERFTRLETGVATRFRFDAAVADALRLFTATNTTRVPVTVDLGETPIIVGDESRVQQVVLNLLQNAVDATRAGDPGVHVTTRSTSDGQAELIVKDHGEGMSEDVRRRAFDPLFTTKQHGSGLGLTIVARILHDHNAWILMDSEPGHGTCFTIRFPVERPA